MTNHTPTPWNAEQMSGNWIIHKDVTRPRDSWPTSEVICKTDDDMGNAESNAAFIVTAVNFHDRLCDALGDLLSTEECVCIEAELEKGNCSVCTYEKLLEEIKAVKS